MHVGGQFLDQYIRNNFRLLLLSILLFTAGVLFGSLYAASLPQAEAETLYGVFDTQNGLLAVTDSRRVFYAAFLNALQLWVLLSLCGMSVIGILFAPLLLGVRGFICGFSVAALLVLYGYKGLGAAAAGLLPQLLLVLPAMQLLCVGAIRQARAAQLTDRALRRSRFLSYCVFCLVLLLLFALAALYEGYAGWLLILKILT